MTISEKPGLVLRKTSLTIRQRLTPAMVGSTTMRAVEIMVLSHWSVTLRSRPLGFFWLISHHTTGFVALKASVFAQGGPGWISNRLLIHHFLVVGLTNLSRAEIDHFGGMGIS